ncbi:FitA-like ribbon-helix-helix domain-containing protein [Methylocystis sp. JAN1]|uniref:FitA-like ribbon-helix-helix domain-containing protein n=1 Tax=Methylocystis sp. JAN1 TaxID=3397211 RepID=UPI003FA32BA7
MNAIIIRTISPQAIARIEELAATHHRTVEEEAAAILERAVFDRASRLAEIDRIAAMTPKGVEQTDSTTIIREARDRW